MSANNALNNAVIDAANDTTNNATNKEMNAEKDAKLPSDTRVVLKNVAGEYTYNPDTHVIVECSDGKSVEVPKEQAAPCPFIKKRDSSEFPHCEFPASVLENLVRWSWKYGLDGVPASQMVRPCVYRDFSYVTTDKWDNDFFCHRLFTTFNKKYYLLTMNAAEKYGMTGLLDFMAIALGCKLRSEDENTIIHDIMGVSKEVDVTEEDVSNVANEYSWFSDVTAPGIVR